MTTECDHRWQWGEGRNAGGAQCLKCRVWQPASSIEYYLRVQVNTERAWRARVVPLLYDCIAETDSLFQETLLRRLDEEVNAAKLLPPVTPTERTTQPKGEEQ